MLARCSWETEREGYAGLAGSGTELCSVCVDHALLPLDLFRPPPPPPPPVPARPGNLRSECAVLGKLRGRKGEGAVADSERFPTGRARQVKSSQAQGRQTDAVIFKS